MRRRHWGSRPVHQTNGPGNAQPGVDMNDKTEHVFTAPVFLAIAVFLFALAIVEKALNLLGTSIPLTDVYPRQLLDWALILLVLDIALLLRQMLENKL